MNRINAEMKEQEENVDLTIFESKTHVNPISTTGEYSICGRRRRLQSGTVTCVGDV